MQNLSYKIDLYFPDYKLTIEIDQNGPTPEILTIK